MSDETHEKAAQLALVMCDAIANLGLPAEAGFVVIGFYMFENGRIASASGGNTSPEQAIAAIEHELASMREALTEHQTKKLD